MAYSCANCGIDHSTKNELLDHMHEKHGCTFLEGDWSADAEKRLDKQKADSKKAALLLAIKANRNEV